MRIKISLLLMTLVILITTQSSKLVSANTELEIEVNDKHLQIAKNATKEGGVFPVEVTAYDGNIVAKQTIFIIVKGTETAQVIDDDEKEEEVNDIAPTFYNDNNKRYEYIVIALQESYLNNKYFRFGFFFYLLTIFIVLQIMFMALQRDVREIIKEIT